MHKIPKQSWESNRDKAKQPRKGLSWCFGCDSCKVGSGQKCPKCGHRHEKIFKPRKCQVGDAERE